MKSALFFALVAAAIDPLSVASAGNTERQQEPNLKSLRVHQDNSAAGGREAASIAASKQVSFSRDRDNEDATWNDKIVVTSWRRVFPGDLCRGGGKFSGTTRDNWCTSRWCKYGRCTCFDDSHCYGSPNGPYCDCDSRSCVPQATNGLLSGQDNSCCPIECKYGGGWKGKCCPPICKYGWSKICDDQFAGHGPCSKLSGGKWRIVRHVPSGNQWHPAKDNLAGTDVYGTPSKSDAAWSIKFNAVSHDQFLFATGDCKKWLVTSVDALIGQNYENSSRPVIASSDIRTPYTPAWYNRVAAPEDPWVSIVDHDAAIGSDMILYGENSFGWLTHAKALMDHNGADVYIRKSQSTAGVWS